MMRNTIKILIACLSFVFISTVYSQASETGAALLKPYKLELKQTLFDGLHEGPTAAIDICMLNVDEISQNQAQNVIAVGRSSHKLRNPNNVAPDWVAPIMESYQHSERPLKPQTITLPNNHIGYVEPIMLKPLCTTCHGEKITSNVLAHIKKRYPEDQATGFKVNDLRGVFWLEFDVTN